MEISVSMSYLLKVYVIGFKDERNLQDFLRQILGMNPKLQINQKCQKGLGMTVKLFGRA